MLKCDICGSELLMNTDGQSARCKLCGMSYGLARLRGKLNAQPMHSAPTASSADFDIRGGVLYRYNGNAEALTIPSHVVEIAPQAFLNNLRLREVTIAGGVRKIGNGAFHSCSALQSVRLSDSIEEIGSHAFYNTALRKVTVPASIRELRGAFTGCPQLQEVTFLNGRTEISADCCSYCPSLTEVRLPSTLKKLYAAFYNCAALKHILLPDGLEVLGGDAFRNCTSLEAVRVPATVREVGNSAFAGCRNLRYVEIPDKFAKDNVFFEWHTYDSWGMQDGYAPTAQDSPWYLALHRKREAAAKAAREQQVALWKKQGRCALCGGQFSGLFFPKCTKCNRSKTY